MGNEEGCPDGMGDCVRSVAPCGLNPLGPPGSGSAVLGRRLRSREMWPRDSPQCPGHSSQRTPAGRQAVATGLPGKGKVVPGPELPWSGQPRQSPGAPGPKATGLTSSWSLQGEESRLRTLSTIARSESDKHSQPLPPSSTFPLSPPPKRTSGRRVKVRISVRKSSSTTALPPHCLLGTVVLRTAPGELPAALRFGEVAERSFGNCRLSPEEFLRCFSWAPRSGLTGTCGKFEDRPNVAVLQRRDPTHLIIKSFFQHSHQTLKIYVLSHVCWASTLPLSPFYFETGFY